MRKKEISLILDVETAGRNSNETLVYDVGFTACERLGGLVVDSGSFIVADVFYGLPELMSTAYYSNKVPYYNKAIYFSEHEVKTFAEVKNILARVVEKYDIKRVYAYNCSFDVNALNGTSKFFGLGAKFFPRKLQYCDIWHMSCQTICNTEKYRKFAEKNGFVSAKGNIQTGAEVVYRYLINEVSFEESHTGLEDVKIESSILQAVLKRKKKVNEKINTHCWKIPQRKRG